MPDESISAIITQVQPSLQICTRFSKVSEVVFDPFVSQTLMSYISAAVGRKFIAKPLYKGRL